MVGTSVARTEESGNGICTHKETSIRGVMGIYENGFDLDDDAGL